MPTGCLRVRVCAFLSEGCRTCEFWIEARIDFRKRMDDRCFPVMMDDPNGCDSTRNVLINELLGRFLQAFGSDRGGEKGKASRTRKGEDGNASHVMDSLQATCQS